MRSLFFILFCFLVVVIAKGQSVCDAKIEGKISDYHSKTPLGNATIEVLDKSITVYSDTQGSFEITNLCPGTYDLAISHPECSDTMISVRLDTYKNLTIKLEHHLEELSEVDVVGKVAKTTNSAQELALRQQTLEEYSSGTLADALATINGVSTLNTGATIVKPIIHGLSGSRILILNNGVRMQDMEWGDEHAPNVDINSVDRIAVIKGAAALQYGGDAIGGVIVMKPQLLAAKDTLFGQTMFTGMTNGQGGNANTEITKVFKNGLFLKAQGSYKQLGDQEAPDYVLSNTGMNEIAGTLHLGKKEFTWGWDAQYSYYEAEIGILRASHIGNVDDLIRSINSGSPNVINPFTYDIQNPKQQVTHHLAKGSFYKRFEGLGKLNLQYDFQQNNRLEFDVRRGGRGDRAALDLQLTTHSLLADFVYDAPKRFSGHFGMMGRYQNNFANPDTGVRRLIPDYDKYDLGVFAIGEYELSDTWKADGGLRYDFTQIDAKKFYRSSRWEERGYDSEFEDLVIDDLGTQLLVNPVLDYHNFSASTGVRYQPTNERSFRLNYSLSQRAPNPAELFSDGLHHSAARIELGDLRIGNETSHKLSASYQHDFKKGGFLVEPYINRIQDFILLEPTGVEFSIRGAFPVWAYRQTNASLIGLDASGYYTYSNHLTSNHQFSIVKGRDSSLDIPLINMPSARMENQLTYSQPKWNNFELSLRSEYVFRQNEFPENIMVFSPQQQEEVLLEVNTPPDAYHVMGLNARAVFELHKKLKLTTSLTINNALNTTYREYLNRQRFFADDLGRNIILQLKLNY